MDEQRKKRTSKRPALCLVAQPPLTTANDLPDDLPKHIRYKLENAKRVLDCFPADKIEDVRRHHQESLINIIRQYGVVQDAPPSEAMLWIVFSEYKQAELEVRQWKELGAEKYLGPNATNAVLIELQQNRAKLPRLGARKVPDNIVQDIVNALKGKSQNLLDANLTGAVARSLGARGYAVSEVTLRKQLRRLGIIKKNAS